jgi:hypothetical protein
MDLSTFCQACGVRLPARYRYACGECWHVWRTGWHLIAADLGVWWRMDVADGHSLRSRLWRAAARVRRAKNIYVCPCCAHDL